MAGVHRVTLLLFMNLQLIFTCHFHTEKEIFGKSLTHRLS